MPSRRFAFALFLSSYSPAWLILAVRSFDHSVALFWVSVGLAVASGGAFLAFVHVARQGGPFRAAVTEVEPRDSELAAYVATYLLPFVVVFGATIQDVLALGLFLGCIGLLWVNSGMIYLNPLLAAMRYHVYIVRVTPIGTTSATLQRSFLLTHHEDLRPGDEVRIDRIGRGVLIDLNPRHAAAD